MITRTTVDSWLRPASPTPSAPPLGARERRALWFEITIVLLVTFGLNGVYSILSLLESALQPGGLSDQAVALNPSRSTQSFIDLARQLLGVVKLAAWAALGLYLLWRSGLGPRRIGLGRSQLRGGILPGVGLAALIGLPGWRSISPPSRWT